MVGETPGFDRVLTLFRHTGDGWRHIVYAQCASGPDLYVREMARRVGTPEALALGKEFAAGIRRLREQIVPPDFQAYGDGVEARWQERHDGAVPAPCRRPQP
jgi:hypothetical protein